MRKHTLNYYYLLTPHGISLCFLRLREGFAGRSDYSISQRALASAVQQRYHAVQLNQRRILAQLTVLDEMANPASSRISSVALWLRISRLFAS
ncbi:hypothetical protein CDAR_265691 [Caerostris darwini]|uniref:Uncharacterized protein n=1 Tax=Caerostris darwini TaxID=1538125 RepID=A0AAV4VWZ3_9ARAC|nr:hypothetical protein CDAR_265691 [Caerostris darwini]